MTAGHFIFIPSVLLIGVVIGWVLGSRAARDAFAVEMRRRDERPHARRRRLVAARSASHLPTANLCASTSGKPALMILFWVSSTAYLKRYSSTRRSFVSTIA